MKYRHDAIASMPGKFAVFTGKQYFTETVTDSEKGAEIESLKMSAVWYRDQMDTAHNRLIELDAVGSYDQFAYLA